METEFNWGEYYAESQLDHVCYFLDHVESYAVGAADQYQRIAVDHANIVSAIDTAFVKEEREIVQRFAWAVGRPYGGYLSAYGYWVVLVRLLESAIIASEQLGEPIIAVGFDVDLGTILLWKGQLSAAERRYKAALKVLQSTAPEQNIELAIAAIYHHLGTLSRFRAEYDQTATYLQKSLTISRRWNHDSGVANTLQELGNLADNQGRLGEALVYYQQSLELNAKLSSLVNIAINQRNIGNVLYQQGELNQSESYWQRALIVFIENNDKRNIAGVFHTLAQLSLDRNELDKARRFCTESIVIKQELGFQSALLGAIGLLGVIAYAESDRVGAARLFRQAITLADAIEDRKEANRQRFNLAMLYELNGQLVEANQLLIQIIAVDENLKLPDLNKDREALERIQRKLTP